MENIKRLSRCCFTGHRPEKLNMPETAVKEKLQIAIEQAIHNGFNVFISGMARSVDLWSAEIVLKEREINSIIKLVCASPFRNFEKSWNYSDRQKYTEILEQADFVKFVCEKYSKNCFHLRNCYMVDRSYRVISAYNGAKGGTQNTINYANKNNIEVINIFDTNIFEMQVYNYGFIK